ncbi:MAG: hypothetical protein AAGK32_07500 [Actinomycetota bacterium]
MSASGPPSDPTPTPPSGTPPAAGDPTAATPAPGAESSSSVFGDEAPAAGADPTVAVPPVPDPGQGTPPPAGATAATVGAAAAGATAAAAAGGAGAGGPGGPEDPTAGGEDEPWYTHPAAITAAALLGIVAIIVILVLAFGGDDDDPPTTTTSSTTTTSTTTSTTAPQTRESRCRAGDQTACDEFGDDQLRVFCDEGVTAACQVLLARQGDGIPDDTTTTVQAAPSDTELCRGGDRPACDRLSEEEVVELCGQGSQAACDSAGDRVTDEQYQQALEDCANEIDSGCQLLSNEDLDIICDGGLNPVACTELDSRTGE